MADDPGQHQLVHEVSRSRFTGVADPPEATMDLKALFLDTDPLALIALGGFVSLMVVSLALVVFVIMKMPRKGEKST